MTTDLIMRVNVRTTTTTTKRLSIKYGTSARAHRGPVSHSLRNWGLISLVVHVDISTTTEDQIYNTRKRPSVNFVHLLLCTNEI